MYPFHELDGYIILGVIILGLVRFFFFKVTEPNFFLNRNGTEISSNPGFGSVRFFRTKTGSNWFGSVF